MGHRSGEYLGCVLCVFEGVGCGMAENSGFVVRIILVLGRKLMKCPNLIYSHHFDNEMLKKRTVLELLGKNLV